MFKRILIAFCLVSLVGGSYMSAPILGSPRVPLTAILSTRPTKSSGETTVLESCFNYYDYDKVDVNNSSAYTTIAQCVFNPGPPVCLQTDINNDGRTDAGDLSACGFCQENQTNAVSDISPTTISTPSSTLSPTFTPTPTYLIPVLACNYCLTGGDPYISIGQCIFNEALPQCTDAMDINQDGILDAGDLTACTRCKAGVSVEPTQMATPTIAPIVTKVKEPCAKKNRGDTDCKEDRFNKSINILDYAIWYTEFIKGCSADNAANCGADEDGDGMFMDANFNYPGSDFEKTDTVVNLFDYAVWIQGLLVENNI